ncbi:MAG: hypothetical protein U0324_27550 [Polyangiales bacterium]
MDRLARRHPGLAATAVWALLHAACTPLVGSAPTLDISDGTAPQDVADVAPPDVAPDAACPRPDAGLAPGAPDPTYRGGRFPTPGGYFQVRGAALDARGRVYVYGAVPNCVDARSNLDLTVVRHREDGALDEGFGEGGRACWDGPLPDAQLDEAMAATVDARGRLYLVGYSSPGGPADTIVARLDEGGRFDPTFNGGRVLLLRPAPPGLPLSTSARGIVADDRGAYVAGYNGTYGWAVRLADDGSADEAFARSPAALDVSVQGWFAFTRAGDALLLAGVRRTDGALVVRRVGLDGAVDAAFGEGGYAVAPPLASPRPLAVSARPGGDVTVAAASGSADVNAMRATAVRFTAAGAVARGFAAGGVYTSSSYLQPDYEAHVLAAECGASLLLGGTRHATATMTYGAVERLDARGAPDPRFGTAGAVYGTVPTEGIAAVLVHPATGWIYVVTRDGNNDHYSVQRYAP